MSKQNLNRQNLNRLRAGVIGFGIGEMHAEVYENNPNSDLIMICDFDQGKLKKAKEKHKNIETTSNALDIINNPEIDIISICSFDCDHAKQTIESIKNKKHVFVEKPLCLNENEFNDVHTHLKNNPEVQLSSNLVLRTFPIFLELKNKLESDELGQVYNIEGDYNYGRLSKLTDGWRGQIPYYSVSHGGGIHLIDLILWLTKDQVKKVCSTGTKICTASSQFKGMDTINSLLEFKSGAIGKISSNYASTGPHHHSLRVYGTKGSFIYDGQNAYYYFERDNKISPPKQHFSSKTIKSNRSEKSQILNSFIDQILNKGQATVTCNETLESMKVSLAIEKSVLSKFWESV